jgi:hypothetical protein
MAAKEAPFRVGARIGIMPNGYSLVPGIVLTVARTNSGNWRGDIRTADGVLANLSLHPDYAIEESRLRPGTRESWAPHWEALEQQGA